MLTFSETAGEEKSRKIARFLTALKGSLARKLSRTSPAQQKRQYLITLSFYNY